MGMTDQVKDSDTVLGCPYLRQQLLRTEVDRQANRRREAFQIMVSENPDRALASLHKKYGSNFSIGLQQNRVWFDSGADTMRNVLKCTTTKEPKFGKSKIQTHGLSQTLGLNNVFVANGKQWEASRKALAPLFAARAISENLDLTALAERVDKHLDILPSPGSPIDLARLMRKLTLDIALNYILAIDVSHEVLDELLSAYDLVNDQTRQEWLFPKSITGVELPREKLVEAQGTIDTFARRVIDQRLAAKDGRTDAVRLLAEARDPSTDEPFSLERLLSEVKVLMLLSHETTASLLTWCILDLARNHCRQKELRRVILEKIGDAAPSLEDIEALPDITAVWREEARKRPPNFLIARQALEDTVIGSKDEPIKISAGDTVVVSTTLANEQSRGIFSFGGGRRFCLGFHLATLEMEVILTRFIQKFEFDDRGSQDSVSGPVQTPAEAVVTLRNRTQKEGYSI